MPQNAQKKYVNSVVCQAKQEICLAGASQSAGYVMKFEAEA